MNRGNPMTRTRELSRCSLTAKELASPLASLFSRWWSCLSLPARQQPAVCLRRQRERARKRERRAETPHDVGGQEDGVRQYKMLFHVQAFIHESRVNPKYIHIFINCANPG